MMTFSVATQSIEHVAEGRRLRLHLESNPADTSVVRLRIVEDDGNERIIDFNRNGFPIEFRTLTNEYEEVEIPAEPTVDEQRKEQERAAEPRTRRVRQQLPAELQTFRSDASRENASYARSPEASVGVLPPAPGNPSVAQERVTNPGNAVDNPSVQAAGQKAQASKGLSDEDKNRRDAGTDFGSGISPSTEMAQPAETREHDMQGNPVAREHEPA